MILLQTLIQLGFADVKHNMDALTQHTSLDSGWVLDTVAGNAPRAVEVFVACHAALNVEARQSVSTAEAMLSDLFEMSTGNALAPGALDRALDSLGANPDRDMDEPDASGLDKALYPAPLRDIMDRSAPNVWKTRFGGYSEILLEDLCEPGVTARLLSIPKGRGAPEHDHGAEEGTLVLAGSFQDGFGRYERGDACMVGSGTVHHPVVDSEEPCICLAVELGALKPTNPIYSLLQTVIGKR